MRKIPTLFKRTFDDHNVVSISSELTSEDLMCVLEGKTYATEKIDGACCAFYDGVFYKRYDAKKGKTPPPDAIPCCEPDPITGHWPHWVPIKYGDPSSKWFLEARDNVYGAPWWPFGGQLEQGTYEAVGPHFNGNPYHLQIDLLIRHGSIKLNDVPFTFEGIKEYLQTHEIEGIVFWNDNGPVCKIKRTDFGFEWPIKQEQKDG